METVKKKSITSVIVYWTYLVVLNIVLMMITGYLTIDSGANFNSMIGAYLLSFFIPIFIVFKTPKMGSVERMLKFGSGYIFYIVTAVVMVKFIEAMVAGLIPCLLISLVVLYYGSSLLKPMEGSSGE